MVRRGVTAIGAVVCALSGLVACQAILGIDDEDGVARIVDAPVESGVPDAGDPCKHADPPPKASATGDGDAGKQSTLFFAMQKLRIRPEGVPPVGYDLDGRCSGLSPSTTSDFPCDPANKRVDDDGGLDNEFGRIVDSLPNPNGSSDITGDALTKSVELGRSTILVQLGDYNGQADDGDVTVALISARKLVSNTCEGDAGDAGTDGDGGTGGDAGGDGGALTPAWNGCDTWAYSPGVTPVAGLSPLTIGGYVTGGTLVARATDHTREVTIGVGGTSLQVTDPIITGQLENIGTPDAILSNGVIAGRVATPVLIGFLARLEVDGNAVCDGSAFLMDQAVTAVCEARDVILPVVNDGQKLQCNAVSFGLGFDARPARMGEKGVDPPKLCGDRVWSCPP